MKKQDLIRIFLTLILLTIVWGNAHWSVALSLNLIACSNELYLFR